MPRAAVPLLPLGARWRRAFVAAIAGGAAGARDKPELAGGVNAGWRGVRRGSEAGCRIRVTDETGAIVILTGVAAARLHAETGIAA
jgi:hypothetical protein